IVQRKLGCPVGIAFDVQAVCSGFVYALSVADGFVARDRSKCALVIGAETMTRLMDWTDRGTCVLVGDGGGARRAARGCAARSPGPAGWTGRPAAPAPCSAPGPARSSSSRAKARGPLPTAAC